MALQWPGADFGALQVLEDADGASLTLGSTAQTMDVARVIFVSTVGEVEARDVHATAEQVAHSSFGVAGGSYGADDLGAAGKRLAWGEIRAQFWLAGRQSISYRVYELRDILPADS